MERLAFGIMCYAESFNYFTSGSGVSAFACPCHSDLGCWRVIDTQLAGLLGCLPSFPGGSFPIHVPCSRSLFVV